MLEKASIAARRLLRAMALRAYKGEESSRESLSLLRDYLTSHEQSVGRKVDIQGHPNEVSDGNEEHAIGQWMKGDPCYKVAKHVAQLQKVEFVRNEIG